MQEVRSLSVRPEEQTEGAAGEERNTTSVQMRSTQKFAESFPQNRASRKNSGCTLSPVPCFSSAMLCQPLAAHRLSCPLFLPSRRAGLVVCASGEKKKRTVGVVLPVLASCYRALKRPKAISFNFSRKESDETNTCLAALTKSGRCRPLFPLERDRPFPLQIEQIEYDRSSGREPDNVYLLTYRRIRRTHFRRNIAGPQTWVEEGKVMKAFPWLFIDRVSRKRVELGVSTSKSSKGTTCTTINSKLMP